MLFCSNSPIDEGFLKEVMLALVQHALSLNPLNTTWLKTAAEVQFALDNMASALRYYLQAASIATHYYMDPVPSCVLDNEVSNN